MHQLVVASDLALDPDVALERGCEIAAANCADLHVLRLRDRLRRGTPRRPSPQILAEEVGRRFPCIGSLSFSEPMPAQAAEIVKKAEMLGAELIVMRNAIDPNQINDRPFDLIVDVARQASIPVLAVQAESTGPYKRLLALLDEEEDARHVLDLALQIKSASEVYAVHACSKRTTAQGLAVALEALKRVIATALAARPDVAIPVVPVVRPGDLASVLIEQWSALHPDLIVASTHRHRGFEAIFRRSHVAYLLEIMPFDLLVTNLEAADRVAPTIPVADHQHRTPA
ncbi:universal stress protein [Sphingomonas pruni]|uniref:universal stress protein n=1 Tax=Sphingomonas pruni TaxID=40683 RepID=UPI0008359539|nr:universal stress protein [Sphingomonas pruni]